MADERNKSTRGVADLFGVELHLVLGLREKLNIICTVDLLGNYSNLISNRELKWNWRYTCGRQCSLLVHVYTQMPKLEKNLPILST